jgi:galactose-6-phosphate isomerase
MPTIDMSEVLLSPEFMDTVTIYRRTQQVSDFGEMTTVNKPFYNVGVVVTTTPPNALLRGEDEQNEPNTFTIISTFRLQGPTTNTQPDLVLYLGNQFIIDSVEEYTRYGSGFVEARMSSIDYSDMAL